MRGAPPSVAARVYAVCLLVLPAAVRAAYGSEMCAMFEDAWQDMGGWSRVRLARRAAWDLLVSALLFRLGRGRVPELAGRSPAWRRPVRGGPELSREIAMAARGLARRPTFTLLVVLTLTVGIGVNASIFGFVNGLLLRPLPYAEPDRLVQLSETSPELTTMDLSLPDFATWRARTRVFEDMFAFDDTRFLLAGADLARPVEGAAVTPGFLRVLGVPPALGRGFQPGEGVPGADGVVIVSDRMWAEHFGRSGDALGSTLVLSGRSRTVVGVAPAGFHFPEVADAWVPLAFDPATADPEDYGWDAIGRLAKGYGLEDARRDGERVAGLLAAASPATKTGIGTDAYPLRYADVPGGVAGAALVLLAAVCLVFLVACSNVAHMLLARGEDRTRELLVRRALGASRGALMRQVFVESALLAAAGSVGALVVATWSGRLMGRLLPSERPFWLDFGVDGRVLGWTLAAGAVACLVTGMTPALRAAGGQARPGSGERVTGRGRRALVRAQVTLASFLVVMAGVAVGALSDLRSADPGLDPSDVLVLDVVLPPWDYPDPPARAEAATRILAAVGALPDVRSASAVGSVPFVGGPVEVSLDVGGEPSARAPVGVLNAFAGPYFETVGIPLLRGRLPTADEAERGAPVAVVSEALAARLWPAADPTGRRIRHAPPGTRSPTVPDAQEWLVVVGVVADVRQEGPGRPARGQLYVPLSRLAPGTISMVLRTRGSPASTVAAVRGRLGELDGGLALLEPTTLEAALGFSLWTERLASDLLGGFGALALFLAWVGVYGVVAYSTRRRERELGVRVALGASGARIRSHVLGGTLSLVAPGLGAGLIAGAAATALTARALSWIRPVDAVALLVTAALFVSAALLAAFPSASRAGRVDPARSLRED